LNQVNACRINLIANKKKESANPKKKPAALGIKYKIREDRKPSLPPIWG
jgi:hypothetical protein